MVTGVRARPDLRQLRRLVPTPVQPLARRAYLQIGPATSRYRMEPSFLVIGGQRCGTTTIFKSLSAHPQVMRPPVEKGTDYYTLHYSRGPSWYRGHFPLAAPARRSARPDPPVAFEACTYYMFHPFAIERIAQDFPDIKLVAMLRDPVERAYSAYKHELARGFDTETDFLQALVREDERLDGEIEKIAADPDYESHPHRHHAYQRRGLYAEQLQRVFEHFDRDQVHVMESERFFANPADEFDALLRFLGLAPWQPRDGFAQHNARPGAPMPEPAKARLEAFYRKPDQDLGDLLGRAPFWKI